MISNSPAKATRKGSTIISPPSIRIEGFKSSHSEKAKTPPFAGAKRRGRNREEAKDWMSVTQLSQAVNPICGKFLKMRNLDASGLANIRKM
jgi:hypothetical protein